MQLETTIRRASRLRESSQRMDKWLRCSRRHFKVRALPGAVPWCGKIVLRAQRPELVPKPCQNAVISDCK